MVAGERPVIILEVPEAGRSLKIPIKDSETLLNVCEPKFEVTSILYCVHSDSRLVNAVEPVPLGFVVIPELIFDFLTKVLSRVELEVDVYAVPGSLPIFPIIST